MAGSEVRGDRRIVRVSRSKLAPEPFQPGLPAITEGVMLDKKLKWWDWPLIIIASVAMWAVVLMSAWEVFLILVAILQYFLRGHHAG
jgi:hypothetical protein